MKSKKIKLLINTVPRLLGRVLHWKKIRKNKRVKILVHLHLFYPQMWLNIKEYLKNLAPYNYDLYVTVQEGLSEVVVEDIKRFKKDVSLLVLQNKGFDVAPFMEVVSRVDVMRYDMFIKLHSKGKRREIFMYSNLFRKKDWFEYLFKGVIGCFNAHKTIDAIFNDTKTGMVAAKNLIVSDPKHKQDFTKEWADKINLQYVSDYKFVAGTCFAIKAEIVQDIKELGILFDDFMRTKRGVFSLAHAVERFFGICVMTKGFEIRGNVTCALKKMMRRKKESEMRCESANVLLEDERFVLDSSFFYKELENKKLKKYELIDMPLSMIKRRWIDGYVYALDEVAPYKYLQGDRRAYEDYALFHRMHPSFPDMSIERFDSLIAEIEEKGYDEKRVIVLNVDDIIMDGQHRACYMMHKYGKDKVLRVLKLCFK